MSLRSNCSMPQPHVGFLLPPRWPLLGPHLESLSGFLCLTFKAFFKSLFSHMVDVPNMVRLSLSRMPQGSWGSSHILSRGHGLDSCPVHATSPGWGTGTKHPLFGLSVCPGLPPQCSPPGPQELEPGAQASVRGCSYMLQGGKLEGSVGSGGRRLGELGGEADVRHGAAQGCRQLPHQWLGLQGGKGSPPKVWVQGLGGHSTIPPEEVDSHGPAVAVLVRAPQGHGPLKYEVGQGLGLGRKEMRVLPRVQYEAGLACPQSPGRSLAPAHGCPCPVGGHLTQACCHVPMGLEKK